MRPSRGGTCAKSHRCDAYGTGTDHAPLASLATRAEKRNALRPESMAIEWLPEALRRRMEQRGDDERARGGRAGAGGVGRADGAERDGQAR